MSNTAPEPVTFVPDPGRWRTLAVCLAVGFITLLDVSVVNVALPSIERSLDAGPTQLQLVVAGYTLAFGLVLVPAGRLGDAGWRRTFFIGGLVGFLVTSLAAGLAPTDDALAIARLAQGICAGLLNPQVVGLIQQQFRGFERGKAFGMFGATIGVSTAVGPLLGGVILAIAGDDNGWRWVFGINVPFILILLPFAWKYVPAPVRVRGPRNLDVVGLVLIAVSTVFVMYPFVTTSGVDDDPARWWWLLVAAISLVAMFFWERSYQRKTGAAVLDPGLLRTPSFRNGALLGAAYFSGFTGVFLLTTLYLQNDLGYEPLAAGLVAMPFAVCSGVSAWLSGRLVHRWGRSIVVVGLVVVLIGMISTDVVIRTLGGEAGLVGPTMAFTLAIAGAGSGLVISPNQTLSLAEIPVERAGVAGSMIQLGQRIGSSLGIAAVLSLYYAGSASGLDGATATSRALLVTISLVAVALVLGILDQRTRHAAGEHVGGH